MFYLYLFKETIFIFLLLDLNFPLFYNVSIYLNKHLSNRECESFASSVNQLLNLSGHSARVDFCSLYTCGLQLNFAWFTIFGSMSKDACRAICWERVAIVSSFYLCFVSFLVSLFIEWTSSEQRRDVSCTIFDQVRCYAQFVHQCTVQSSEVNFTRFRWPFLLSR